MKLNGKSKAALLTGSALSVSEFMKRSIEQHKDAVQAVRKLLKETNPAALEGATNNQIDFWAACYQIPKGHVASYGTLSRVVQGARGEPTDAPRFARMAGKCMAQNVLAPIVPCHRVVGSNGELTGFKGETTCATLSQKARMLKDEGVPVEHVSGARYTVRRSSGHLL